MNGHLCPVVRTNSIQQFSLRINLAILNDHRSLQVLSAALMVTLFLNESQTPLGKKAPLGKCSSRSSRRGPFQWSCVCPCACMCVCVSVCVRERESVCECTEWESNVTLSRIGVSAAPP